VEKSQVTIQEDATSNIENASVQDPESPQMALPIQTWNKTRREDILRLLESLPTRYFSQHLSKLARRFLNAGLEVPAFNHSPEERNVLLIRAEKLAQMGYARDAFSLLKSQNSLHLSPLYLELKFQSSILAGDFETAAAIAKTQAKATPSLYWEKALTLCQIQQKQLDAARLSLAILEEHETPEIKDFITAAEGILNPETATTPLILENPDILTLLLLNGSPQGLTADVISKISKNQGAYLLTMLPALNIDPKVRLAFLEEAVQKGFMKGPSLAEAYGAEASAAGEVAALPLPELLLKAGSGAPTLRALLFERLLGEQEETQKTLLLQALVANAKRHHLYDAIAKALDPFITGVEPEKGTPALADEIIPLLLLTQKEKDVTGWGAWVRPTGSPTTVPLFLLGAKNLNAQTKTALLTAWVDHLCQQKKIPQEQVMGFLESVLVVLKAFNIDIPYAIWAKVPHLPAPKSIPFSPSKKHFLKQSIQEQHMAESLAMLLGEFDDGKERWTTENISFLLEQLQALNLKDVAIEIATEFILALPLEAPHDIA